MSWKSFLGLDRNSTATAMVPSVSSRLGNVLTTLVFVGVACSFLAVIGKCGWMQLVERDLWASRQQEAQSQIRWSNAQRGKILDRNGLVLAEDHFEYRVAIDPYAASRVISVDSGIRGQQLAIDGVLHLPGLVLDQPRSRIEAKIEQACLRNEELASQDPQQRSGTLIQYIPIGTVEGGLEQARFLRAKSELHRALGRPVVPVLEPLVKRRYPFGSRGTLIVGELRKDRQIGLHGVELFYNDQLKERRGLLRQRTDAGGRHLDPATEQVPMFQGQDVQLTVGIHEQALLESVLEETWFSTGARSVTGIVMDPRNGEIIAIGTYPGLQRGDLQRLWNQGRPGDALPKMLQALHLSMEPGSVVKPLILSAALQDGFRLEDGVDVRAKSQSFDGRRRIFTDSHLLRDRTVLGTVVESSNIGIVDIGRRLGKKRVHQCLTSFGLGRRTGIDLPGEERGAIKPLQQWSWYTLTSASFGYEIQVTPLQLIGAYCVLANGGVQVTPHLNRDTPAHRNSPGKRIISAEISSQVRFAMREVMRVGTGKTVGGSIEMAGKTGTAKLSVDGEYLDGLYTSSFIGFAPWQAPQRIAMVVVEQPDPKKKGYYASKTAAPAVRELLEGVLRAEGNRVQQALEQQVLASSVSSDRSTGHQRDSSFFRPGRELEPRQIDPSGGADSLRVGARSGEGEASAWDHDD
ncbi:MAG: penicillin-binding protein 2 [Planctomycetota bacterium]|nr:penicillin-binding protein 2 [Planctomycetota bacterium]